LYRNFLFGSGEAALHKIAERSYNLINKELEAMKFELIGRGVKIQYVLNDQGMEACRELGNKIARALQLGGIVSARNGVKP